MGTSLPNEYTINHWHIFIEFIYIHFFNGKRSTIAVEINRNEKWILQPLD